ncbi:MAG: BglII/BstYI family type II restriction endonuclease [Acidimicrobiales bacterium]
MDGDPERGRGQGEHRLGSTPPLSILAEFTLDVRRGETEPIVTETEVDAASDLIDNIKVRLAIDVEWHAEDGNLDSDLAAYRSLYDAGIVDAASIITVKIADMRA